MFFSALFRPQKPIRTGLATSISSKIDNYSAFAQFFQLGNKCVGPAWHVSEFADFPPVAIQNEDRRKTQDLILRRELFVLFPDVGRLGLGPREIRFHQNQIFARVLPEFRLGKNLPIQPDAPAAPVGAGELEEQKLVARFGFLLRSFIIGQPFRPGMHRG